MALSGFGETAMGGGAATSGGSFDWGSLLSNPLVLQMMASMGASLDPEGPAGAIGGVTNQWIQNQSYMKMMKKMLAGGAKFSFDGKGGNIKFEGNPFGGTASDPQGNIMSIDQPSSLADWTKQMYPKQNQSTYQGT